MHLKIRHILLLGITSMLLFGCSTEKAKWANIRYHNTTCHYNVWWNGNESLKAGKQKLFKSAIDDALPAWREIAAHAVKTGIPMMAVTSALSYFDGYTTASLPANLLQAQRDYFGAHTYERIDRPRGVFFHTNWTGRGGNTSAETYTV